MSDKHVRMTIEFDIDQEALDEHGLSANDVFKHLVFREDDVADGFRISTNIPGLNPVSNFFLCSGKVVSQDFITYRSKSDGLDEWRRMVRDEIDINPEVHDIISDDEKNAILDANEIIDELAKLMEIRMQRGDRNEYDALEIVFQMDFPQILNEYREDLLQDLKDELTDIINEREDDDIDYRRALWLDERYVEVDNQINALNQVLQKRAPSEEKTSLSSQIDSASSRVGATSSGKSTTKDFPFRN